MPKPSNAKIQSLYHCGHLLWEYSFYVRRELRNPVIYLTSAVIGLPAVWMMNAPSIIPFLVPFIAEELGFDLDFVENIGRVAALHDIGKVAIPELIKLARPFNRDQRLEMQMHTIYGARIIETMMAYSEKEDPRMVMARNIALHHHQTFNGKGYPRLKLNDTIQGPVFKDYMEYQNHAPLSGVEIPAEALIVGLADRYDALRSRRPYKKAYSHEKTLAVLEEDDRSGINGCDWYGVEIWGVFEKHHPRFKDVFERM